MENLADEAILKGCSFIDICIIHLTKGQGLTCLAIRFLVFLFYCSPHALFTLNYYSLGWVNGLVVYTYSILHSRYIFHAPLLMLLSVLNETYTCGTLVLLTLVY